MKYGTGDFNGWMMRREAGGPFAIVQIKHASGSVEIHRVSRGETFGYNWGDVLTCTHGSVGLRTENAKGDRLWLTLSAQPQSGEPRQLIVNDATVSRLTAEYRRQNPDRASVVPSGELDLRGWAGGSSR